MSPKLIMGAYGIFMLGTMLACLTSGRWLLNGETDIINSLASFNTMSVQAGGVWNAPKTISTYWDAAITALSWGYPFLASGWAIFLKMPLWIVSVGVIWGFIQVAMSVISGLVSVARSILPG